MLFRSDRVPEVGQDFLDREFDAKLERVLEAEGKAIQAHLTRNWTTKVSELLKEFSMEKLGEDLHPHFGESSPVCRFQGKKREETVMTS